MTRSTVLALALATCSTVTRANADDKEASGADAPIPPGEVIVVTGLRLPRAVKDTPTAVIVVDRAELERSPLVLADDLLRAVPSVGTFRRSSSAVADPTSQGLNLRGVGPSAVSRSLVLRDGLPANDPFGGWMYWRAISPLSIERVEIAPAGASALFGNFALGGVVDIVSRPITERSLEMIVAGGSLGTGRAAVRASDQRGAFGAALDIEAYRTSGYTPVVEEARGPIDGDATSAHVSGALRVEHTRGDSRLQLTARYFREALDAGTQFTTADVSAGQLTAGWTLGGLHVAVFGGVQRFEQDRARVSADRTTAALASAQTTPSNDQGALASYTLTRGAHTLTAGIDGRRVAGSATDRLNPVMVEPMTLVEREAGGEQRFAGVFVQDALHLGERVELAAALRLDGWQNHDGFTRRTLGDGGIEEMTEDDRDGLQLDPRLGVLVRASDHVSLRATGYRAFRAPTLNELYRPFQVGTVLTAANSELRPETLWGAEAGAQVIVEQVVVRATAFWNQHRDVIANVTLPEPLPSGAIRQRQNLGTARIAGLELDASWHPTAAWTFAAAHTFVHARLTDGELAGNRLPHDPALRTTLSATFDDARIATVTAQVRHLGRSFEDDRMTLPIGAVVLVDARVSRRLWGGISAFASVQNLFDRRFLIGRAGVDTEGAPRMFEVGLSLGAR